MFQLLSSVESVPLSRISPGPNAARLAPHDPDSVAELADAISVSRWVEPLTGHTAPDYRIELDTGHKRLAALLLLVQRGELSADAAIPICIAPRGNLANDVSDQHRTPIEPLALLRTIRRLQAAGHTQTAIAKLLGRNKSQICRYAGIQDRCQIDVWQAVQKRRFSLAELCELSRLTARQQRLRVGLDPLTGPPAPPRSNAARLRTKRVATVKTELRRVQRLPRSRERLLVEQTLAWALSLRQNLPI